MIKNPLFAVSFKSTVAMMFQVLLTTLFLMEGYIKLSNNAFWIKLFHNWGYPDHFYQVVGVLELIGGLLLMFPKTVVYASYLLMVLMLGAAATHIIFQERQIITVTIIFCQLLYIAYVRRPARVPAQLTASVDAA